MEAIVREIGQVPRYDVNRLMKLFCDLQSQRHIQLEYGRPSLNFAEKCRQWIMGTNFAKLWPAS